MRPEALNEDYRDLLVAHGKHQVELVIVGAWALAAHGHPRATVDFDVLVRPARENAAGSWQRCGSSARRSKRTE